MLSLLALREASAQALVASLTGDDRMSPPLPRTHFCAQAHPRQLNARHASAANELNDCSHRLVSRAHARAHARTRARCSRRRLPHRCYAA